MSNDSRLKNLLAEHREEQRRKERGLMSDSFRQALKSDAFNEACGRDPFPTLNLGPAPKMDVLTGKTIPSEPYKTEPRIGSERTRVSDPVNKTSVRAHSHYFRDVSKLTDLDVYRICDLFVDDRSGATQHALKKILLPGQRGGKDRMKDYQEAVDTLNRKIEMMKEDVR